MLFGFDNVVDGSNKMMNLKSSDLNNLNVLVIGRTGAGKSTLINHIFRDELCRVGTGLPISNNSSLITKKGFPLSIYEIISLEMGADRSKAIVLQEVIDKIKTGLNIDRKIHCIWYCMDCNSKIDQEEIEWLCELCKISRITQIPVILLLTQSYSKKRAEENRNAILNQELNIAQIIPVVAKDFCFDGTYVVKTYGIETLFDAMAELLPAELQDTIEFLKSYS